MAYADNIYVIEVKMQSNTIKDTVVEYKRKRCMNHISIPLAELMEEWKKKNA